MKAVCPNCGSEITIKDDVWLRPEVNQAIKCSKCGKYHPRRSYNLTGLNR